MDLPRFQDPLMNGFSRITIRQNLQKMDRSLILKIADVVLEERTHPKPNVFFSKTGDPVLARIFDLLRRERYHLAWDKIVIIGCSAGGDVALRTLFKSVLVPHIPIIIAMHHNPGFRFMTQFQMANSTTQRIIPTKDGESIRGSRIYFIPGEMEVHFSPSIASIRLKRVPHRRRFRPEIDQVFSTAGSRFRNNIMGVIMSGMLKDGALGAKAMALNHGEIWIQEPKMALFKDMPNAAMSAVPNARVKSVQAIAERINQLTREYLVISPVKQWF